MMKRTFFITSVALATLFCGATTLSAQETPSLSLNKMEKNVKHEVSIGWGYLTQLDFFTVFSVLGDAIPASFFNSTVAQYDTPIGTINLDYAYHITPKILVGANVSFGFSGADLEEKNNQGTKIGRRSNYAITLMPTFKWNWVEKEKVTCYSRVSVGAMLYCIDDIYEDSYLQSHSTMHNQRDKQVIVAVQVSPFGVEFGSLHYRGFFELGFGQAGLAQLGFRARF